MKSVKSRVCHLSLQGGDPRGPTQPGPHHRVPGENGERRTRRRRRTQADRAGSQEVGKSLVVSKRAQLSNL